MVYCRVGPFLSVLSFAVLLSSYQVLSNGDENAIVKGINEYRKSRKLSELSKNSKASCVADEVANDLKYYVWNNTEEFSGCDPTGVVARLVNFPKHLRKCLVEPNATAAALILPIYMTKLNTNILIANYTHSSYAKFLNASKFTGIGVGIKYTWTALILTTHDPAGNFSSEASVVVAASGLMLLLLGFLVTIL